MDFSLSDKQKLTQEAVKDFCNREVFVNAELIESSNIIPPDLISKIGAARLFGIPFETRYGGTGGGYSCSTIVLEELAKASGAVSLLVSMNYLASVPISLFGSEYQKSKYLYNLSTGNGIGSFAFTEAATGSDPRSITSEAILEDGYYILNGLKRFVTAGDLNGIIVLSVHDGNNISAFISEKGLAGYSVTKKWDKLGMRGVSLVDVHLSDHRVPADNLLGISGSGYELLLDTISIGKLNTCAIMLGCAQSALDEAVDYAKGRIVRGKPIAQSQGIQSLIAEIAARVEAARWLTYRLASLADNKRNIRFESALTKLFVTEAAVEAARLSFKVHGAYAYVSEYRIGRILRDIYLGEIVEGSNEVQKAIIASGLLK